MARTRAEDYDDKRALIFERAAELFAESGFERASIADLALRCRASKSWIYHYFPSKEAILYEILLGHMHALLVAAGDALAAAEPPHAQLRRLLRALMAIYIGARPKQIVLLTELDRLRPDEQGEIRALERRLVDMVAGLLVRLDPQAISGMPLRTKPITMMLFGMINSTFTWYRAEGALAPQQLADLAADLMLGGLEGGRPVERA
jgi:AcrR family transcriptional regulator